MFRLVVSVCVSVQYEVLCIPSHLVFCFGSMLFQIYKCQVLKCCYVEFASSSCTEVVGTLGILAAAADLRIVISLHLICFVPQ